MSFGQKIIDLRNSMNITRQEFADKLGITYSSLSKYETGARFPDQDTLKKIALALNTSTDYLLDLVNKKDLPCNETIYSNSAFHVEGTDGLTEDEIQIVKDLVQSMKKRKLGKWNFSNRIGLSFFYTICCHFIEIMV